MKNTHRALTFLQEIRDAISERDKLILVVSPEAIRSEYVKAEWQYAYEICKHIVPIILRGGYEILSEVLKRLDTPNFQDGANHHDSIGRLLRNLQFPDVKPAVLCSCPSSTLY
jgi:CRISPR/Cas system CSM-associated protein Csm2 small subunit